MKKTEILELFRANSLRATPQRICVFTYLLENRCHADAEQVYSEVKKENPSFSKTTVYNALGALCESGLIIPVTLESGRVRYDADTALHGHFKCKKCSTIYDFNIDSLEYSGLDGFETEQKDVYFSGICARCKNNELN